MSRLRTRMAVALIAMAVIALELALMRVLALRFWHHFAAMVVTIALLGFGASGTFLAICRRRVMIRPAAWLSGSAIAFALATPVCLAVSRLVPLDVQFLAWHLGQIGYVVLLEAILLVPFLFAATALCVALMDRPQRIAGHYAANLIGSGLGALAGVLLMLVLTTSQLLTAVSAVAFAAGIIAMPWRRNSSIGRVVGGGAIVVGLNVWIPYRPLLSPYKALPQLLAMDGTQRLCQTEGPLGRIDVLAGPAIHAGPALSLQYTDPLPDHKLLLIDGDTAGAVYNCTQPSQWRFMDFTTGAAPYHLRAKPTVLVIGAGGGADIGLARYHDSPDAIALEMNPQLIRLMTGRLAICGGAIYEAPNVKVVCAEARGYLSRADQTFDLIQLPTTEALGASGAGLYAAQENYLYTVEAFGHMIDHLSDRGILAATRWARTPPRDGLRLFDTAAQALRRRGLDPRQHLAMIRSLMTVTVLAGKAPLTPADTAAIRAFCTERSFDVCYLPDIRLGEVNQFHQLAQPFYFDAAGDLLGSNRPAFLAQYPFAIAAATDDKPYFSHFLNRRTLDFLGGQSGRLARSHLEMGAVLLGAALVQSALLGVVLIVLPLAPGAGMIARTKGAGATLGYFLLIGAAFMLLEMGFLQKLILYLAHPIYAAAVAIGSTLIFAGLGSQLSTRWRSSPKRITTIAAIAVVALGAGYVIGLGPWLQWSQGLAMPLRTLIAAITIAPLAIAMGHLMPVGLRQIGAASPALVPWAWAVNGCASVVATVAAPLMAMTIGFTHMGLIAVGLYAFAGVMGLFLPTTHSAGVDRPSLR